MPAGSDGGYRCGCHGGNIAGGAQFRTFARAKHHIDGRVLMDTTGITSLMGFSKTCPGNQYAAKAEFMSLRLRRVSLTNASRTTKRRWWCATKRSKTSDDSRAK